MINLKATGSYVALSEIEIYVREDPAATTQTPYSNENGTGYILPEGADTNFEFDKVLVICLICDIQQAFRLRQIPLCKNLILLFYTFFFHNDHSLRIVEYCIISKG